MSIVRVALQGQLFQLSLLSKLQIRAPSWRWPSEASNSWIFLYSKCVTQEVVTDRKLPQSSLHFFQSEWKLCSTPAPCIPPFPDQPTLPRAFQTSLVRHFLYCMFHRWGVHNYDVTINDNYRARVLFWVKIKVEYKCTMPLLKKIFNYL